MVAIRAPTLWVKKIPTRITEWNLFSVRVLYSSLSRICGDTEGSIASWSDGQLSLWLNSLNVSAKDFVGTSADVAKLLFCLIVNPLDKTMPR